jgi:prepilin-type processing-associated H-X9-DG protein
MKTTLKIGLFGLILALAQLGANAQENNPYIQKEKERFEKVSKHLDPFGNFYFYMNVEEMTGGVTRLVDKLEKSLMPVIEQQGDQRKTDMAKAAFKGVGELYRTSGIPAVSGMGISSLQIGKDMYRTKSFIHTDSAQKQGMIWRMMGGAARPLDCVDFLPKTTTMAVFCDFDLEELWKWQFQLVQSTQNQQLIGMHQMMTTGLSKNVDMTKMLGGLYKTMGMVITLDPTSQVTIPIQRGQTTIRIPEPGLAIFIKTKDNSLQDFMFSKMVNNRNGQKTPVPFQEVTNNGVTYRAYPIPLPSPIPLALCVGSFDGQLVITSSTKVMNQIIAAKKTGNGLKSQPKLKALMADMPKKGNAFTYLSKDLQVEMLKVQDQLLKQQTGREAEMVKKLVNMFRSEPTFMIGVGGLSKDGYYSIAKSNVNGVKVVALQAAVIPVAIGGAMLLPVLSKAKEKARRANCSGNLKQMGLGLLMYSGDFQGKFPKDLAMLAEKKYLPASKVYLCPSSKMDTPPKNAAEIRAGKCSYLYFGNGLRDDDSKSTKKVIVCDKPGNHGGQTWINALFIDGHVEGCRARSIEEAARQRGWIIPAR